MARLSIALFALVALFVTRSSAQGGTSPTGEQDGTAIYTATVQPSAGNYKIKAYATNCYMNFNSNGNIVSPTTTASVWELKHHSGTKYFSLHINKGTLPKCVSTRWVRYAFATCLFKKKKLTYQSPFYLD
jgi:hypothetical protein